MMSHADIIVQLDSLAMSSGAPLDEVAAAIRENRPIPDDLVNQAAPPAQPPHA